MTWLDICVCNHMQLWAHNCNPPAASGRSRMMLLLYLFNQTTLTRLRKYIHTYVYTYVYTFLCLHNVFRRNRQMRARSNNNSNSNATVSLCWLYVWAYNIDFMHYTIIIILWTRAFACGTCGRHIRQVCVCCASSIKLCTHAGNSGSTRASKTTAFNH